MIKIGSHVSMSGKDMLLGAVEEANRYNSNTFMIYTGAPQNTRRKDISELNIELGIAKMKEYNMSDIIIHAPYIINLANSIKAETFELATQFLRLEIDRAHALGSTIMVLHPGAHVGAGTDIGIKQIINGLNEVLEKEQEVCIALETMAGKGTEIGRSFEEIARIYDGVKYNDKLRVCFDTCHVHDSGYDIVNNFEGVMSEFNHYIGSEQIGVFHINDSKNIMGAKKDRHENIGYGQIGFKSLYEIVQAKEFLHIPKILETPYVDKDEENKKVLAPYKYEIEMLRTGVFNKSLFEDIRNGI